MEITTYTNFRKNLKSFLDNVFLNHNPLFVTRTNGEDVVVLSQSDYNSMQESLYLLGNPNNAKFLNESIKEVGEGKTVKYSFSELKKLKD
ncbi:MAG: type II toxin-antitoxin system prevent-host-death family antitoxin [Flavobacteriales bacterium]|nr:MAG: type II toxin-antitoxin system prevent-host-death family antitoxin [Flavobacteriales bacterium]